MTTPRVSTPRPAASTSRSPSRARARSASCIPAACPPPTSGRPTSPCSASATRLSRASPTRGVSAQDHDPDLPSGDAPGVDLIAGIDLPGHVPDGLPLVLAGLAGAGLHALVPVGNLGGRVRAQVVVPARRARLPEPGADDGDVIAVGHAQQRHGAPRPGA